VPEDDDVIAAGVDELLGPEFCASPRTIASVAVRTSSTFSPDTP
jgi:hypothetical protein